MAFAPRRDLLSVPSRSMSARSRPAWSVASRPATVSAISPLTFSTAFVTPLPPNASPPSRSSVASNSPVEAPLGTAARPAAPERRTSSTSTVGLPRLSRIWRAWTFSIWLIGSLVQSGLGVEGQLVVGGDGGPVLAGVARETLGRLDAPAEPVARRAQRELRVDAQLARDVDGREQHVADLVEQRRADVVGRGGAGLRVRAGCLDRLGELGQLAFGAGERALDTGEVEAGGRRPALHLAGVQQRGEVLGDVAEDAALAARLGALDLVPVAQDLAGRLRGGVAEDVRMAADELRPAMLGDVGHVARAALLEQQRQEVHLEEHVAELVEQLGVVAGVRGVGELVGLLDGVRDDRALVLLAIPRALAAQAAGQLVEAGDGGGDVGLGHRANPRGFASARGGGVLRGRGSRALVRAEQPHERLDELRVELAAGLGGDLGQRVLDRPGVLVRAGRHERVVHVADRADAPGDRDLLAAQAGRVAGAVPALVVRAGDRLGELEELRARVGEHRRADRRVGLHDLPLLAVELARLEEDAVRDADLADVVEGGRVTQELGLGDAPADRGREPLAEPAHALDVLAGVAVA